ncbi:MAG: bifunctional diaminohydroxyphosphoribosylaminopyrimidine deaminase/5-amino-6-(5-phosphoribosylamino)uracil reductase RibD [Chlamydiales bacterium]|nr:bifunctional diaminohydroxyphosphoribosylaminopyrimidine deaminase/5-amino-6-(5-phosphoribosylamino)uracil reductase RibD [Chlamydiales bacterium]
MRRAISLAEQGRASAPPNPWVGCVIVKSGAIVGEGFHVKPGALHAEAAALAQAKGAARGATAYVTLEPCSHTGRTPPCTKALIEAGISRVVIPFLDPDAISGEGVTVLREAGITVDIGTGKEEAYRSLAPYLHHRKTGMPYCILKTATSIDGGTKAADGTSKWITSEGARADCKRLRTQCQAILIGSETAIQDNPSLKECGLRVILDRRGRVPDDLALFQNPTLVFTASDRRYKNAETIKVGSLKEVLLELGRRGIIQLFVEGGSTIHTAFFEEGFVNKYIVYIGNCLLGSQGLGLNVPTIEKAPRLKLEEVVKLGNDCRLTYSQIG